jgi:pimeloyl-ACP methyl ester carboxylesterase
VPSFRSLDDVEIAYYRWGPPTGRPLVLLHGFISSTQHSWEERGVVAALVSAGHRVVAIDHRGHGRSGKPHDPALYGETKMACDVIRLLDIIDAPEVGMVGYSMGAVVALIATACDKRIGRLAIGGVGASVAALADTERQAHERKAIVAALRADDPATITSRAVGFRTFADYVGGDRLALAAQAEALHRQPLPLDRITVPTLILAGDADVLAPGPEKLAGAIPGSSLQVVPGDHLGVPAGAPFISALVEFFR